MGDINKQLVALENSLLSIVTSLSSLRSDNHASSGHARGGIPAFSDGARAGISAAKARIADMCWAIEQF